MRTPFLIVALLAAAAMAGSAAPTPTGQAQAEKPVRAGAKTLFIYDGPAGIAPSPDYTVEVNGKPVFVYNTKVRITRAHPQSSMGMAYFDFAGGPVTVKVTANVNMTKAVLRPKSYGIKAEAVGKALTFTLTEPRKIVIEPDGMNSTPLAIFANAFEDNAPKPGDPGVVFFGPGIHDLGPNGHELKSNETIFIGGGAVVRGSFHGRNVKNVRIIGHGIIDLGAITTRRGYPDHFLMLDGASDVEMSGPICLDGPIWCVEMHAADRVKLHNVKIIGWRANSDGIDICSSRNVTVDDCFIRNWDDGVVIKTDRGKGEASDISVTNSVFWNDLAEALEIGFELDGGPVTNVLWKNIDIIHAYHNCAISIHNAGLARVSKIRYEDIRIEDINATLGRTDVWPETRLLDLWIGQSVYSKEGGKGTIRDVVFKNVSVTTAGGKIPESRVTGFDAEHDIDGVTFEHLTIDGRAIAGEKDGRFVVGQGGMATSDKKTTPAAESVKNLKFVP